MTHGEQKRYFKRLSDRVARSAACLIDRHDECTERGYRHGILPHLSAKDQSPCKCECGHLTPANVMDALIMEAYRIGVLE